MYGRRKRVNIEASDMEDAYWEKQNLDTETPGTQNPADDIMNQGDPQNIDLSLFISRLNAQNQITWKSLPGYNWDIDYSLELILTGGGTLLLNNLLFQSSRLSALGTLLLIPGIYLGIAKGLNFFSLSPEEKAFMLGDTLQDDFLDAIGADRTPKNEGECPPVISGWLGPLPVFGAWSIGRNLYCRATGKGKN